MDTLETSAKTVEEAVQLALTKLGVSREDAEIVVLSEGKSGILGFRAEDARVRVTVRSAVPSASEPAPAMASADADASEPEQDPVLLAKEVLENILQRLQIRADVTVQRAPGLDPSGDALPPLLDIEGDNLGSLIGRRGETLSALQFLVNLIVGRRVGFRTRVIVDVQGYRRRRETAVRSLALRMAEQVEATQQPVALEAMPANERRIVHLALASHPHVATQSTGEGERRKVLIVLKR